MADEEESVKFMSDEKITYTARLKALAELMAAHDVDAYLVPHDDEYMSEYLPPHAERMAWLTGFTGSSGRAMVIGGDEPCGVFLTDGRYDEQARKQLDNNFWTIEGQVNTTAALDEKLEAHISSKLKSGQMIGFDPRIHTVAFVEKITKIAEKHGLQVQPVEGNLVDYMWQEGRPAPPASTVFTFPEDVAGRSASDKIEHIMQALRDDDKAGTLLVASDSIAWLLNIRAGDIPATPVALSYLYLNAQSGTAHWFIDKDRVNFDLPAYVGIENTADIESRLTDFAANADDQAIGLDCSGTPYAFYQIMEKAGAEIEDYADPCIWPRAIKAEAEQEAMRRAHIIDGVAIVRLLRWLEQEAPKGTLTELDVVAKIEEIRGLSPDYAGMSFDAIVGFAGNGAVIHYKPNAADNKTITEGGVLLIDSGGQYRWGTTDITRTLAIGDAPVAGDLKEHFTRVLQGHIALASHVFEAGATGADIDAVARAPLKAAGLNYAHGTGHGVGCYLSVHESSASISGASDKVLKPGMILSNEPGYYVEGSHGIRLENLVLVIEREDGKLAFETISFAPFDLSMVDETLLDDAERQWLNDYHARTCHLLQDHLQPDEQAWLEQATRSL